jgi:hypothetical protein
MQTGEIYLANEGGGTGSVIAHRNHNREQYRHE